MENCSNSQIITGDCLEKMKNFPNNYFTNIVTDPPYGLKFMGKKWDHGVPGVEFWQVMLRICKPGSFLLAFGGTRTYHRLACAIEDAGWEIRDCLQWIYGSGFPKSHNNFGLEGYGTALKPAYEPIIMAMKPLDGTFAQNVEKWGIGGINIDGSRIGNKEIKTNAKTKGQSFTHLGNGECFNGCKESFHTGRWPANILLDEESAKQLDEQSGFSKSIPEKRTNIRISHDHLKGLKNRRPNDLNDSGGASRFFYCAKASPKERNEGCEALGEKQTWASQDKRENNSFDCFESDGRKKTLNSNHHPTVKPIKLMKYLINLVMPPENGLLLDPFAGSGTTILAAKQLGFKSIGIEKEEEYVKIANARLEAYKIEENAQLKLFKID